ALWPIISGADQPVTLVISALGKTTNALEDIVSAACKDSKETARELAAQLEQDHLAYAQALLEPEYYTKAVEVLNVLFTELQWAIDDSDAARYDYSYDQIVCVGELLSTRLMCFYLQQQGFPVTWIDIRDVVRT